VKRLNANVNNRLSLEISKTLFLTYVPPLENITDTNTNLKWRLSKKYSSYLAKTFLVEKCFIIIIFQLLDCLVDTVSTNFPHSERDTAVCFSLW